MKSEKQILNFGKKIIKEEIIALNKIQKHLGLSFAKAINIINNTNITSTNGVTFISLIGSFDERLRLKAILYY